MNRFLQRYIAPVVVPMGALAVIGALIISIGEIYLNVHDKSVGKDSLRRPELWISIAILLGVIVLMALLARTSGGPLAQAVVIGRHGFWDDAAPHAPIDPRITMGQPGFLEDVQPGYTLYALSGPYARVLNVLPGGRDYGRTFRGMLHAEGVSYGPREMWIPIEAVSAVYPDSQSAMLAIKGDEAESFGWTLPPENFTRGESKARSI